MGVLRYKRGSFHVPTLKKKEKKRKDRNEATRLQHVLAEAAGVIGNDTLKGKNALPSGNGRITGRLALLALVRPPARARNRSAKWNLRTRAAAASVASATADISPNRLGTHRRN